MQVFILLLFSLTAACGCFLLRFFLVFFNLLKVEFVLYQSLDGVGFPKGRHQYWCMGVHKSRYIDQKWFCFLSWQYQLNTLCFSVSWRVRCIVLTELEWWSLMERVTCSETTAGKCCKPICFVSHWIIRISSLLPHPFAQNCSLFGKDKNMDILQILLNFNTSVLLN